MNDINNNNNSYVLTQSKMLLNSLYILRLYVKMCICVNISRTKYQQLEIRINKRLYSKI